MSPPYCSMRELWRRKTRVGRICWKLSSSDGWTKSSMSEECSTERWTAFSANLPQYQNIGFFSGGTIVFSPPSSVLLLGYCNGSFLRLSPHTLFSVTPCTNISPSYSSQSGNPRFRSYATCFSHHLPLSFGPIHTRIHTPITYRTIYSHIYIPKYQQPPYLPTRTFL